MSAPMELDIAKCYISHCTDEWPKECTVADIGHWEHVYVKHKLLIQVNGWSSRISPMPCY